MWTGSVTHVMSRSDRLGSFFALRRVAAGCPRGDVAVRSERLRQGGPQALVVRVQIAYAFGGRDESLLQGRVGHALPVGHEPSGGGPAAFAAAMQSGFGAKPSSWNAVAIAPTVPSVVRSRKIPRVVRPTRSVMGHRDRCSSPSCTTDGSVDRGVRDREQLLELADGVAAGAVQADEVGFLLRAELWLLAA